MEYLRRTAALDDVEDLLMQAFPSSAQQLLQFGPVPAILWKLLNQLGQKLSGCVAILVSKTGDRQQQPGVRRQIVASFRRDFKIGDAFFLVSFSSRQAQQKAAGCRANPQYVVFDTDGEIGVCIGGIDGNQLLGRGSG